MAQIDAEAITEKVKENDELAELLAQTSQMTGLSTD